MFWIKSKENKFKIDNTYKGLRYQALNIKLKDLTAKNSEEQEGCFCAVVDMPMKDKIATLVCMIDGTTNLYYSNGTEIIEAGLKFEAINKSAHEFLIGTAKAIPFMKLAEDTELPHGKESRIFLKCGENIFTTQFDMDVEQITKYKIYLNFLIQTVIASFVECGLI